MFLLIFNSSSLFIFVFLVPWTSPGSPLSPFYFFSFCCLSVLLYFCVTVFLLLLYFHEKANIKLEISCVKKIQPLSWTGSYLHSLPETETIHSKFSGFPMRPISNMEQNFSWKLLLALIGCGSWVSNFAAVLANGIIYMLPAHLQMGTEFLSF